MADDLQARLEGHSKAFEGLMSLIPAKYYYGEDNSDQWQRKKQTKEEKRKAKKAKLDPANRQSALDVHRENERKRKRELGQEDEEEAESGASDVDDASREKPMEGLKSSKKQSKKQKTEGGQSNGGADPEVRQKQIADKRREARERKKAKKAKEQEKKEAKKARKSQSDASPPSAQDETSSRLDNTTPKDDEADANNDQDDVDDAGEPQLSALDFSGLSADDDAHSISSKASTPASPIFDRDTSNSHSSASSSSSSIPSNDTSSTAKKNSTTSAPASSSLDIKRADLEDTSATKLDSKTTINESSKSSKLPPVDPSVLQARLAARLEALRAARKADGLNGKPARNRQELIEARRRKEEQRRAHKKELRAKARIQKDAEAEAARLRGGSGSPLWSPAILSPKQENNFEFGRVAFDDGAELDSSLQGVVEARSKKGPSDTKTALQAAQKKKARVSGLDVDKRADIEEKDRWLAAKKRVHGEKLRDDASLLKKTLKREEKQKGKSEKAWNDRTEGVRHGQEMRQKKREENLQKRRDGKGASRKGAKKLVGKPKPKKRPGFEGSFKAGGARK